MSTHPKYSTLAYGVSALLDAVDGYAARALGETSKFGAVLDMVVDRYVACVLFQCIGLMRLQLRDVMSSLLPDSCVSILGPLIPVFDCSRFQQPLHAHV